MSDIHAVSHQLSLQYRIGPDDPARGVFFSRPVLPEEVEGLAINVYVEEEQPDPLPAFLAGRSLQVELGGSAAALYALGTFLVALARLRTDDPSPHEHIDEITSDLPAPVHMIIRRVGGHDGTREVDRRTEQETTSEMTG